MCTRVKIQFMVSTSILKPSGTSFGWCINQYVGCSHGCKYCYGMHMLHKDYDEWLKARAKDDVIENLEKDIRKLQKNNTYVGDIMLSSVTDSYQPIERKLKLTRQIVQTLEKWNLPFTILTKNELVLRDIDLFKNYKWCRIGVTIVSLKDSVRQDLEPFTSSIESRINALKELNANGISTYVSIEPMLPIAESNPLDIVKALRSYTNLFEFGMWTRYDTDVCDRKYSQYFRDDLYRMRFRQVICYCEKEHIDYGIAEHSRRFFENYNLPYKTYPPLKSSKPSYEIQNLNDF